MILEREESISGLSDNTDSCIHPEGRTDKLYSGSSC